MSEYKSIKIVRGSGGYGGPLIITPTEKKNKILYICGGEKPEIVYKMEELSGMTSVDGFKTSIPDEEVALAIVNCGGTLRCGIYPKKGIPTVNILPTGKSGPLANFINEEIYVSNVGLNQIYLANEEASEIFHKNQQEKEHSEKNQGEEIENNRTQNETKEHKKMGLITRIGLGAGKVIATFNTAAKRAVETMLTTIIPFMAFVALLIGIITGSGLGEIFAKALVPLAGNIVGLILLGLICSLPFLSPILGPGAVIAQIIGTLIGVEIGKGNIPPQLALPALFAIDTQSACDFIPVGLGLQEAKDKTIELGVPAVLYQKFIGGTLNVVIAYIASIGLYQ